jgi:hypothetical protein
VDNPITILVSSAVYGYEALLNQVYGILTGYGFRVWMSHKGTLPVTPGLSAFANCLEAVRNCDVFLSIITGSYGSGKDGDDLSITHREVLRAIELDKPRFFLVHRDVVTARQLLRQFRRDDKGDLRPHTFFKPTKIFDDIRIIDVYEAAVRSELPLSERTSNWVQQYDTSDDVLLFLTSQFSDPNRISHIISPEEASS